MEITDASHARLWRRPPQTERRRAGPNRSRCDDGDVGRRRVVGQGRGRRDEVAQAGRARRRELLRRRPTRRPPRAASSTWQPAYPATSRRTRWRPDSPCSCQKGSWIASEDVDRVEHQVGWLQEHVRLRRRVHPPRRGAGADRLRLLRRARGLEPRGRPAISPSTPGTWWPTRSRCRWGCGSATGGMVQSFKSGEGLVFDFEGPGKVWTQTRNPNELLGWVSAALGSGSSGGPGQGVLGGLMGRG